MRRAVWGALLAFVVASPAAAQPRARRATTSEQPVAWPAVETAPLFLNAGSEDGVQWLTMQCAATATGYARMRCTFESVSISRPSDEAVRMAVARSREAMDREYREHRAEIAAELRAFSEECSASREAGVAEAAGCACFGRPDAEVFPCMRDVVLLTTERDERACRISTQRFTVDLERIGPTRWTGNVPQSGCASVTTVVLDADASFTGWTYTQTRVAVDRSDPLCAWMTEGAVMRFSTDWRGFRALSCDGFRPWPDL